MCTLYIVHVGKCFRMCGTNPKILSASTQLAQYEGYFSSETGWYFILSLPFLIILWHWEEVLVVWNRLELSSGSSDQLNQPAAGPSCTIVTTVPRGITLKKRKNKEMWCSFCTFPCGISTTRRCLNIQSIQSIWFLLLSSQKKIARHLVHNSYRKQLG